MYDLQASGTKPAYKKNHKGGYTMETQAQVATNGDAASRAMDALIGTADSLLEEYHRRGVGDCSASKAGKHLREDRQDPGHGCSARSACRDP